MWRTGTFIASATRWPSGLEKGVPIETVSVLLGQVSVEPGQSAVAVPVDVAATSEYRTGLIRVYLFHGEAAQAREVSASLVREGDRSPQVLMLRVRFRHDGSISQTSRA